MNSKEIKFFLNLGIRTINEELIYLKKSNYKKFKLFKVKNINEFKISLDKNIEKNILKKLLISRLNIISEESPASFKLLNSRKPIWVLDPLDGTFNYARNLLSCSISLALFINNKPVFGIIGEFPSMKIAYGGKNLNSFYDSKKIKVSKVTNTKNASIVFRFPFQI